MTRYLFTSREFDEDTGLQYNRARWYDGEVGRWISQDPLGFDAGDTNLVRYVGNSATLSIDPSGLEDPELPEGTRLLEIEGRQYAIADNWFSNLVAIPGYYIWRFTGSGPSEPINGTEAQLSLYQQAQIRRNTQVQVIEEGGYNIRVAPRNLVAPHEVDAIQYAAEFTIGWTAGGVDFAAMGPVGSAARASYTSADARRAETLMEAVEDIRQWILDEDNPMPMRQVDQALAAQKRYLAEIREIFGLAPDAPIGPWKPLD